MQNETNGGRPALILVLPAGLKDTAATRVATEAAEWVAGKRPVLLLPSGSDHYLTWFPNTPGDE